MRRAEELKTLLKSAAAGGQGLSADTNRDIGRNTNEIPFNHFSTTYLLCCDH